MTIAPAAFAGSCKAVNQSGEITTANTVNIAQCSKCSYHVDYCGWDNGKPSYERNPDSGVLNATLYFIARDSDLIVTTVYLNRKVVSTDITVRP